MERLRAGRALQHGGLLVRRPARARDAAPAPPRLRAGGGIPPRPRQRLHRRALGQEARGGHRPRLHGSRNRRLSGAARHGGARAQPTLDPLPRGFTPPPAARKVVAGGYSGSTNLLRDFYLHHHNSRGRLAFDGALFAGSSGQCVGPAEPGGVLRLRWRRVRRRQGTRRQHRGGRRVRRLRRARPAKRLPRAGAGRRRPHPAVDLRLATARKNPTRTPFQEAPPSARPTRTCCSGSRAAPRQTAGTSGSRTCRPPISVASHTSR